jgi:hypothetical protein
VLEMLPFACLLLAEGTAVEIVFPSACLVVLAKVAAVEIVFPSACLVALADDTPVEEEVLPFACLDIVAGVLEQLPGGTPVVD